MGTMILPKMTFIEHARAKLMCHFIFECNICELNLCELTFKEGHLLILVLNCPKIDCTKLGIKFLIPKTKIFSQNCMTYRQ